MLLLSLLLAAVTGCGQGLKKFVQDMSIRKTFEGSSKDEAKPGNIFYSYDYKEKQDVYNIDLGIKVLEQSLFSNRNVLLNLIPTLEYHVDKRDTFKTNNASVGLNIQYQFWGITDTLTKKGHDVAPYFLLSSNYQGDFVKDEEVLKVKGYLSVLSPFGLRPSVGTYNKSENLYFRYYPYVGYERYNKLTSEQRRTSSFGAARLFFELWPGSIKKVTNGDGAVQYKGYVQLTLDASVRVSIDDKLYSIGNNHWVSAGLNYYFLGMDKVGLGVEYSQGYDPTNNFVENKKLTIGIKIKT
jgi:hypothetical protein